MRYDLYYIKYMSVWFDLRILIDTVKVVLLGRESGTSAITQPAVREDATHAAPRPGQRGMSALHAVQAHRAEQGPAPAPGAGRSDSPRWSRWGRHRPADLLRGLAAWLQPDGITAGGPAGVDPITAIVSVADDGGSSGRPAARTGCLRWATCATACWRWPMSRPRCARSSPTASREATTWGDTASVTSCSPPSRGRPTWRALSGARRRCVRGRVLPASADPITLRAHFDDGSVVEENRASRWRAARSASCRSRRTIRPLPGRRARAARADLIVLGPGSLYTSLLPVLLIPRVAAAISAGEARVARMQSAHRGRRDGRILGSRLPDGAEEHVPQLRVDDILLNDGPIPASALQGCPKVGRPRRDGRSAAAFPRRARRGARPGRLGRAGAPRPLKLGRLVMELALETPQRVRTT